MTFLAVLIGSGLGVVALFEIIVNFAVLAAILKGRLWTHRGNPIYIFAANNLVIDNLQLLVNFLYLVPSIALQSWLFPGGEMSIFTRILSGMFVFFWNNTSLCQILMALNSFLKLELNIRATYTEAVSWSHRLIVLCVPSVKVSNKMVCVSILIGWIIALILSIVGQYVLPCCRFSFNYNYFSYSYELKMFNYSDYFIDLPVSVITTSTCVVCYTCISWQIRKYRLKIINSDQSDDARKTKAKEYRYSMQFCWMSMVYSGGWITFRVFPIAIGAAAPEYYSIITLCLLLNCGANGIIFLNSNSEIHAELQDIFGLSSEALSSSVNKSIPVPSDVLSSTPVT